MVAVSAEPWGVSGHQADTERTSRFRMKNKLKTHSLSTTTHVKTRTLKTNLIVTNVLINDVRPILIVVIGLDLMESWSTGLQKDSEHHQLDIFRANIIKFSNIQNLKRFTNKKLAHLKLLETYVFSDTTRIESPQHTNTQDRKYDHWRMTSPSTKPLHPSTSCKVLPKCASHWLN